MYLLLVMFCMLPKIRSEIDHSHPDFIDNNVFLVNTDSESNFLRENAAGDKKRNNLESDVSGLTNLRKEFPSKPKIGYLNINSLGNKINYLRKVFFKCPIDRVCIDKTKIDFSFPSFILMNINFHLSIEIEIKKAEGKFFLRWRVSLLKRVKELEGKTSKIICIELTFSKKKWLVAFAYRPLRNTNKDTFFDELSISLDQVTNI